MMNGALPTGIEAYLREAGFSPTELLVLRKLLEEDALTLRQLAAKTGKSTGVLDQAMKKLLRRNIAIKEWINETYKYRILSLQAIMKWMEEDTKQKQEMLRRRHQNFEAFIHSLQVDQKRPEMQYYEGDEGLIQGYRKLLDHGKEPLHYFPVLCAVEDDPLRDFRVEYFRERRRRGIFSRFVVHDTPLGRRFATRDPFEYRKTILVPEEKVPITFEKVVVGDVVACFNHVEKRVCFLCYPELAETERKLFERVWREQENAIGPAPEEAAKSKEPLVPLSTRTLSSLREFLLSRKSLSIFGLLAVAAGIITYGLYLQNYNLNIQRMRERAMSIVAMGAMQFDTGDLDQLRTIDDIKKPEYVKVVQKLREIRSSNDGIIYSWIMRPSNKKGYWDYVADADSIDPFAKIDSNFDGVIDKDDEVQYPGLIWDEFDSYIDIEMRETFSTPEIHSDKWGTYITTSSPIRDTSGKAIAIFGVDFLIEKVSVLTRQSFNYFLCFAGIFLLLIIVRLAAFNRSLMQELFDQLHLRNVLLTIGMGSLIAAAGTYGLYRYSYYLNTQRIRERAMAIATTGAMQFDARDLSQLRTAEDIRKPEYAKAIGLLNEIRSKNEQVRYAWIMRYTGSGYAWEFVADADSIDPYAKKDLDGNGIIDEADHLSPPGEKYEDIGKEMKNALNKPHAEMIPWTDQWGTFLSGEAPIFDATGKPVAVLGIDYEVETLRQLSRETFAWQFSFIGIFITLVIVRLAVFNKSLLQEMWQIFRLRRVLIITVFCVEVAFFVTLGMYYFTLNIMKEELGNRLIAIASTSLSRFNVDDIGKIHFARDMQTDAYQRVFRELNMIRNNNPGIDTAYILRPTGEERLYQVVADTDVNYDRPNEYLQDPGVVWAPGAYYVDTAEENYLNHLTVPAADKDFVFDTWGTWLSGFAPIKHRDRVIGILGMDYEATYVYNAVQKKFQYWLWFVGIFAISLSSVLLFRKGK